VSEETHLPDPQRRVNRRAFLRLGSAAAAVGLVAACGPGSPGTPSAAAPGGAAPTGAPAQVKASGSVKFWHVWGGDRQPIIEKVIADFQYATPGIKVEHTVLSQQGLQEKYLTSIAGGDTADVIMLNTRDLPSFASRNALRDVTDLIARDKVDIKGTFYAGEADLSTYKGKMYGMPLTAGGAGYLVFWNKAHFRDAGLDPEKGPADWSTFAEYSRKLTKGSNGNFERVGSLFWNSDNNWLRQWAYNNNADLYSADGAQVKFNAKENVEALQYLVDNTSSLYGGYDKIRSFATQPGVGGAEGNQSFFQRKLSMHLNGVFHFLQLSKEAPDLEFGVTVFPFNEKNPAAKTTQLVDGVWDYVLPKSVKNVDGAWELVKYFCAGQGQADFFKAQGRPSVVPKYNQDPEYTKVNPNWPVIQAALNQTRAMPVTKVFPEDMQILATHTEEAVLGKRTATEAMEVATREAQQVHDEKLKA
jgi:multiple sugar transport system substrate-binding protein